MSVADSAAGDPMDAALAAARSRYERVDVAAAVAELRAGAVMVDIRPAWQRAYEGEVDGALIVERNHLEWRLHPRSEARLPEVEDVPRWIVVCSEGYTSSLAADSLNSIGVTATDLVGGIRAWREAGQPLLTGGFTPADRFVGGGSQLPSPADLRQLGAPTVRVLH